MTQTRRSDSATARAARIAWTILTIAVVQSAVFAFAALPVVLFWSALAQWTADTGIFRALLFSVSLAPAYAVFAFLLMGASAASTRLLGWQTADNAEMRISDVDWPLLDWVRYMVAIHVVRVFAGLLFRGSPIWTAYLRLAGARMGRRVYINSLAVSDYNLLEFGDDVVIGGDVHIAAHTVERGVVKTAAVRLERGVNVGLGSVVDIGVQAGERCQIAALSFVPKHSRLDAGALYAGIPIRKMRNGEK